MLPANHPRMAHYLPYSYGDSLQATARAAMDKFKFIDKNLHASSDLVPVVGHWGNPKQDGFTHLRQNGVLIPDPHAGTTLNHRPWAEIQNLTDATGTQQYHTAREHLAEGVANDVLTMLEAKGSPLMDLPEFWERLGADADAVGHPRVMMTLTDIGFPVKRLRAAKAARFQTAILPRGKRPGGWDTYWAQVVDATWGTWAA